MSQARAFQRTMMELNAANRNSESDDREERYIRRPSYSGGGSLISLHALNLKNYVTGFFMRK